MIKKIHLAFLILNLCGRSLTLAIDKPGTPQPAKDAADEAARRIADETAAAIRRLGATPSARQVSAIVFKAVRASSDSVLPIVAASVRVSPLAAAPEIVTAATAAVPNRWKKVIYCRLAVLNAKKPTHDDAAKPDSNQTPDTDRAPGPKQQGLSIGMSTQASSGPDRGGPGADPANGIPMTLAEAIIRTAFDANFGLSLPDLQAAANAALLMDPAVLMQYIQSPRAASGVGDAGLGNYANEPLLIPKLPVVSR